MISNVVEGSVAVIVADEEVVDSWVIVDGVVVVVVKKRQGLKMFTKKDQT